MCLSNLIKLDSLDFIGQIIFYNDVIDIRWKVLVDSYNFNLQIISVFVQIIQLELEFKNGTYGKKLPRFTSRHW